MKKYLIVSYDPDQQQWFYDLVFANDASAITVALSGTTAPNKRRHTR